MFVSLSDPVTGGVLTGRLAVQLVARLVERLAPPAGRGWTTLLRQGEATDSDVSMWRRQKGFLGVAAGAAEGPTQVVA